MTEAPILTLEEIEDLAQRAPVAAGTSEPNRAFASAVEQFPLR